MNIVISALFALLSCDLFLSLLGCIVASASIVFLFLLLSPIPSGRVRK